MSKSVGNIFQLSEAIDRYGGADRRRLSRLGPLQPAARLLGRPAHGGRGARRPDPELPDGRARRRARRVPRRPPPGLPRRPVGRLQHAAGLRGALRDRRRGQQARASRSTGGPRGAAAAARARLTAGGGGGGAGRGAAAARRPPGGEAGKGLRARGLAARPARRRWAGRSATRRAAPGSSGAERWPSRERIYGRRPVAEAERGQAPGPPDLAIAGDAGRGARAALWVARPPGRGRRGRPISVRRPGRPVRGRRRPGPGRRPRPDPGPAQPRRGLPCGRGGRGGGGCDPGAAGRLGHRGGLQGVRWRRGAPAGGAGQEPGGLARRGEGGRCLDLRRRRRRRPPLHRCRLGGPSRARARLRGKRPQAEGGRDLRRARLDPHRRQHRVARTRRSRRR